MFAFARAAEKMLLTIHGISVILSAAKDPGRIGTANEILRCAQDDTYVTRL
jgi:hypothetical protein